VLGLKVFPLKSNCLTQVQGYVEDVAGTKVASLMGKWDDSMYYTIGSSVSKARVFNQAEYPSLLWKRSNPSDNPNRYNLSSFAITLNELKQELKVETPYGIKFFTSTFLFLCIYVMCSFYFSKISSVLAA